MNNINCLLQVFNASPAPGLVLLADAPRFTITEVNDAYLQTTGTTRAMVINCGFFDLPQHILTAHYKLNQESLIQSFLNLIKIGGSESIISPKEELPPELVGIKTQWDFENTLITDSQNNPPFIYHCLKESSCAEKARKALIRQLSNQTALINCTGDYIWSVDRNFCVITANDALKQMVERLTGMPYRPDKSVLRKEYGEELNNEWTAFYERGFAGEIFSAKHRIVNPSNKTEEYRLINCSPMRNELGEVFGVACLSRNITAETLNLWAVEKVKNELNKILDLSLDVICTINSQAVFVSVSAAAEKIWGYAPAELEGKSLLELIHPLDYSKTLEYGEHVLSGNYTSSFENRYIHKKGQVVNMLWSVYWDAAEQLGYCVAKDTTEKNRQQEELKLSEKKYRYLFENNPSPMFIWDVETLCVVDCNEEALLLYGYTKEDFLQLNIHDIHPKEDTADFSAFIKENCTPGHVYKDAAKHIKKTNELIYVNISGHIINYNGRNCSLLHITDETEKHEAELRLKNRDKLYRALVENSGDGVVILNVEGGAVSITEPVRRILGYSNEAAMQLNINELVHPDDSHIVAGKMLESFQHPGKLVTGPPLRMRHNDNGWRWLEASLVNMIDEPAVQGIICNFRDITDRINAEEELKISEERYRLMFQFSPLPKWIYDIDTLEILEVNETAISHYGYSGEEFLNMTIKDLRRKEDVPALLSTVTANRAKSGTMNSGIFTHTKKNGDLIRMEISGYQLRYMERDCIMVVSNDVTERENALQQLKDKETKLLTAQQIAHLGYWQFDPVHKMMFWSDEVFSIWGIEQTSPEVPYDAFLESLHKDDRGIYENAYSDAIKHQTQLDVQYRMVLPDGGIKWIHEKGMEIKGAADNGFIFEGTIQDITESVLAREQLLRSEARHRGIVESQTNYIIRTDLQGNYSFYNAKYMYDYGWLYNGENLIGKNSMLSIQPYHLQRVEDTVRKCFENPNSVLQVELDKIGKKGNTINTLWDFTCITDSFGNPEEIQCVGIDISARKKAEDALAESNIRYEYVTKATSDAIWDWDITNSTVYRGEGFKTIFGYSADDIKPEVFSWKDYVHPKDVERATKKIQLAIAGSDTNCADEYRFRKKNGDYAHVLDKGLIIRDEKGKATRMVGAMQDVTKQKEEEQRLKLLESVITNTSDSVVIAAVEPAAIPCPVIVYVNEAFTKMTGYTADEVIGKSPRFLQGINTDKAEINRMIESFRNQLPCEITTVGYKKNGEEFWVNSSMSIMDNLQGITTHWIAVQRDITQKKIAALELQKVYEEKTAILESVGDVFFAVDKSWAVTYWNNQAEKKLQIQKQDILNKNLWDAYSYINKGMFRESFKKAVDKNEVQHFEDFSERLQCWFEISVYPSANGLSVYFKDINDRKIADQKINSERNLLRTLIDNLPDAIYFKDKLGRKLISNKPDFELLGATDENEVIGKTDLELLSYKEGIVGYTHDMKILKSGESLINFEQHVALKNKQPIWLQTTKLALRNQQNEIVGLLGIGRNITQEKLAEQNLLVLNRELNKHVKQLAASNAELEQFAYIASHDLQEPLRMVTSFLAQIELKYNPVLDDTGKKFIHFAVDGAKRMRQIILDLLQFSRIGREEDKAEAVDMKALAEDVMILCGKQIEEAKAVINIGDLPTLSVPRSPLRQVFQNLISNSLKYYDHTKEEALHISIVAAEYQQYWEFSITDNGIGIDPMFFDKIFVIFQRLHNQKEYSGTGIGLAITKKIIENMGGKIWVQSEEGKGCTFYFTIQK
jgi:PAS domain S-box-containing protein